MAQQQLSKDNLTAQYEEQIRLKRDYLHAGREWVRFCSQMQPPLEMVKYIVDDLKKNPNNVNEKKWLKQVGVDELDINFTGSSCGSSASTIMSSGHRQRVWNLIPTRPSTPQQFTQQSPPLQQFPQQSPPLQQFPQQSPSLQQFPQQSIPLQQYPSQGFSQGYSSQSSGGATPMVVDADQHSQGDKMLLLMEGIRGDIGELKEQIAEVKNRQDRIEGI